MAVTDDSGANKTNLVTKQRVPFWSFEGPWIWMLPAVALLLLYSIYPLVYNITNSFREFDPLVRSFVWVGFDNWAKLFRDERVLNALRVTFLKSIKKRLGA